MDSSSNEAALVINLVCFSLFSIYSIQVLFFKLKIRLDFSALLMIWLFEISFLIRASDWVYQAIKTRFFKYSLDHAYWKVPEAATNYLITFTLFYFAYEMKIIRVILESNSIDEKDKKVRLVKY